MDISEQNDYLNCKLADYIESLPDREADWFSAIVEDSGVVSVYTDAGRYIGEVAWNGVHGEFHANDEKGEILGVRFQFDTAMGLVLDNAGIFVGRVKMDNKEEGRGQDAVKIDMVARPPHYTQYSVECIQIIEEMGLAEGFCRGNALKYLWRAGDKGNKVEDLRKAAWYATRLADYLEKKDNE